MPNALRAIALLAIAIPIFGFNDEDKIHPSFDLVAIHPDTFSPRVSAMDFLTDGRLALSTWRPNEVFLFSGIDGPRSKIKATKIAAGFKDIMGLKVVSDTIFLVDQEHLWALADTNKDGIYETRLRIADIPYSGGFHEWSFGLAYADGHFFTGLSVAASQTGVTLSPQKDVHRGAVISIDRLGRIATVATGFRAPEGLCLGPDGELFATDNQGTWLPASKLIHVRPGRTYGHRIEPNIPQQEGYPFPPAVWLPYGDVTRSPTEPAYAKSGPYAGQMFYGDIAMGVLRRVFLEKVKGEYQGCVFRFSGGFEAAVHRLSIGSDGSIYAGCLGNGDIQDWGWAGRLSGLQRLRPNGKPVFEIHAVHARKDGFEIEFSRPIKFAGLDSTRFSAERWWYEPTAAYGGSKKDVTSLRIRDVTRTADGTKVSLRIDGLLPQQVIHVQTKGIRSEDGQTVWTPEFWYTLNFIPDEGLNDNRINHIDNKP
ncbi:MAG TPA: hypothetical protein VJ385_14210 [Fibrobacteria bacterium]|nr:hypothetical protein [Fibrobacteria bacterium]